MYNLFFKKKSTKPYSSIESCPIYRYSRVIETGNLEYLLPKKIKITNRVKSLLDDAWTNINDEYFDRYGISDEYKELHRQEISLAKEMCQYIIDDKAHHLNQITYLLKSIELKKRKLKSSEINEVKYYIEKDIGIKLDEKTTSVREFFDYYHQVQKNAQRMQASLNKKNK